MKLEKQTKFGPENKERVPTLSILQLMCKLSSKCSSFLLKNYKVSSLELVLGKAQVKVSGI